MIMADLKRRHYLPRKLGFLCFFAPCIVI